MRDAERSKSYEAEHSVWSLLDGGPEPIEMFGMMVAIPDERKFGSVEAVQEYVNAVLRHMGSSDTITVRKRKGVSAAHYSSFGAERPWPEIAVPDATWALREMVILHELAHHFTPNDEPAHGQIFRRTLCDLAEKVLAPEARFLLQVAYGQRGLTL